MTITHKNEQSSNLGDLLLLFRRSIMEKIHREGLKSDLTFPQIEIIHFIGISGRETMKSIADHLKIKPPSATEIVREMEKKGLVKRIAEKKDRRIVSIILAESTKKRYLSISKHKEDILNCMISRLNKKDQVTLEKLIRIIIK
jgi:DNA-binding MarR family transcriptional regulator